MWIRLQHYFYSKRNPLIIALKQRFKIKKNKKNLYMLYAYVLGKEEKTEKKGMGTYTQKTRKVKNNKRRHTKKVTATM